MRAPSSAQEAKEIAAEIAGRPNLATVINRLLALLETDVGSRRRASLEAIVASLDVGLRPGEDISERERDEWMRVLA